MITTGYISYLFSEVFHFTVNPEIILENNRIILKYKTIQYEEPFFNHEVISISQYDRKILNEISSDSQNYSLNTKAICTHALLKYASYFIKEFYLNENLDIHNRQQISDTDKELIEILKTPVVDVISYCLSKYFDIPRKPHKVVLTCDYDILDLWQHLGFKGTLSSLYYFIKQKDFFGFANNLLDYILFLTRLRVKNNYMNDRVFCIKNDKLHVRNIAFWLVYNHNKKYDARNNFSTKQSNDFIQYLKNKKIEFGLHTSYNTLTDSELMKIQIELFEKIFGYSPVLNRFHFLRIHYPESLNMLTDAGISEEFSFYFSDSLVFRGGLSSPFKVWDNTHNKPLDITIHPITIMDGTLAHSLQLNQSSSIKVAQRKIEMSVHYGTETCLLWHNRSMYKYGFPNNYYHSIYPVLIDFMMQKLTESNNKIHNL